MQKYRVFVSIPIEKSVKKEVGYALDRIENDLEDGSFRFLVPDLWHLTLLFLGDQDEESVAKVALALEDFAQNMNSFEAGLDRIDYGPSSKDKRMIWLLGDADFCRLGQMIRDSLQDLLISRGVRFNPENNRFLAHATLARREKSFANQAILRPIDEPIKRKMEVREIELVSSTLTSAGPEYEVLASYLLMS